MKNGFTLAEVLITIGIIGVIAAITIPGLIRNYRAIVLENQFKEQYSRLAQTLRRMVTEEEISLIPENTGATLGKYLAFYYNISIACKTGDRTIGCTTLKSALNQYKTFSGNKIAKTGAQGLLDDGTIVTKDGITLYIEQGAQAKSTGYYLIGIDINGHLNKPNRLGHDLFVFKIGENGELLATTKTKTFDYTICSKVSSSYYNGYGCAEKAINDKGYFKNLPK